MREDASSILVKAVDDYSEMRKASIVSLLESVTTTSSILINFDGFLERGREEETSRVRLLYHAGSQTVVPCEAACTEADTSTKPKITNSSTARGEGRGAIVLGVKDPQALTSTRTLP